MPKQCLAKLDDFPDNGVMGAEVQSSTGGFALILIRDQEQVHAFLNECPHAGRRLDWSPNRFLTEDQYLVCAAHGAMFDRKDGFCISGPCRSQGLRAFPVRVIDGEIWIA
jgi:nitrite reductase/ring-hydroxylating ferredoxin subunit